MLLLQAGVTGSDLAHLFAGLLARHSELRLQIPFEHNINVVGHCMSFAP